MPINWDSNKDVWGRGNAAVLFAFMKNSSLKCCRPIVAYDDLKNSYPRSVIFQGFQDFVYSSDGGAKPFKQDCMIQVQSYSVFS